MEIKDLDMSVLSEVVGKSYNKFLSRGSTIKEIIKIILIKEDHIFFPLGNSGVLLISISEYQSELRDFKLNKII